MMRNIYLFEYEVSGELSFGALVHPRGSCQLWESSCVIAILKYEQLTTRTALTAVWITYSRHISILHVCAPLFE